LTLGLDLAFCFGLALAPAADDAFDALACFSFCMTSSTRLLELSM
jgi:hypothetical protein